MYASCSAACSVLKRQALRSASRTVTTTATATQVLQASALPTHVPAKDVKALAADRPSSLLHRVPWRPPISVSGEGIYIVLEDGRRVIDAVGGAAVACLGNSHPAPIQAMKSQMDKLNYVYSMQLSNEPAEELADYLIQASDGAFHLCAFVSGGTEAMESVLKTARQYFVETKQPQRSKFIARQLSYHGNSLSTLALAYHPGRRAPYQAVLDRETFHHVAPAYAKRFMHAGETEEQYVQRLADELEAKFQELGPENVIGFVAETVVGASTGVVSAPKGYFAAMKRICHKHGALFILDEVMCGMGRMGSLHAWQTLGDGVSPDIQAVAKGLGGGYVTIGAVLMNKRVADGIRTDGGFWKHGHTYQSHPLSCSAALAVQKAIVAEDLLGNIRKQGDLLHSLLTEALLNQESPAKPYVFDIRGAGGFWAVEFDFPPDLLKRKDILDFGLLVQAKALDNGMIAMGFTGQPNQGSTMLLSPAYNVSDTEIRNIASIAVKSIEQVLKDVLP